ncbi:MAG: thymidine phosphorylase [Alphaproteobacteria bacterium RIFCSPHIGHO2_12_42_13]|nr:MAG: thymidine phosphorylase [Alphaproteobacteria bacterium RIFCSPHIGHO2_12_42_13]
MTRKKPLPAPLVSVTSLTLKARKLGIDTRNHFVAVVSGNCSLCKSAGFRSEARIQIENGGEPIIATLYVASSAWIKPGEIGLSSRAWERLKVKDGQKLIVTLAEALDSFAYVRAKLHRKVLSDAQFTAIIQDMVQGKYSDIQLSAFVAASADLNQKETTSLTKAMTASGRVLKWSGFPIVDKHCVGGLPGNRTTMILVPIVAACGLTIPKTSSRAITSPAGTADTMEVFAPVTLTLEQMRKVVDQEGGCIVLGGSVDLSPVDDLLVQIERALDLDSHSQLIASVLSKKMAAGSTHVIIDIPVGPTAKIRSAEEAHVLKALFVDVAKEIGLAVEVVETDGTQPIRRGIGPALEARDVLSVLKCKKNAPQDLRQRSLFLAGKLLELCECVPQGKGHDHARRILDDGHAFKKFEAICLAQGGFQEPTLGAFTHKIFAPIAGRVLDIDNRRLARIAKLAGAPDSPQAGVDLDVFLNTDVEKGDPLFTIYADSPGELDYALHYFHLHRDVILIGEKP